MASRYFGVNRGQQQVGDVVEGSSTGTKSVEIAINLAAGMDRGEVLLAIEVLEQAILQANWPPA